MCVKPMAQPILGRSRQLQDEMCKTERLKDFKEAPSVHDNMRALGTQLLKGDRLARLVGKSNTPLCVGKQMIKTASFITSEKYITVSWGKPQSSDTAPCVAVSLPDFGLTGRLPGSDRF